MARQRLGGVAQSWAEQRQSSAKLSRAEAMCGTAKCGRARPSRGNARQGSEAELSPVRQRQSAVKRGRGNA